MHWWRRKQREQDLERELRADLYLKAAEQQQNGLSEWKPDTRRNVHSAI